MSRKDATGASREQDATANLFPLSCNDPGASVEAMERSNSSNANTNPPRTSCARQERPWDERRAGRGSTATDPNCSPCAERGATVAQSTRWLRIERNVVVAATTVGRWLDSVRGRGIHVAADFDAVAAFDELRERERELRFPRHAASRIDPLGYHVLRLRARGATIGECHRALRDDHGLRVHRSTVSRWLRRHRDG